MNNRKLTIDEFNTIKEQMMAVFVEKQKVINQNRDNPEFNLDEFNKKLNRIYSQIQKSLLSYDLSDIPFDCWKNLEIISEGEKAVDFSKTKANIDFDLFAFYQKGNFKNCNIINLDSYSKYVDENNFDLDVIENNPHLFLSDMFSNDFKTKYYDSQLKIEDLVSLSSEQLLELKNKDYLSHFNFDNVDYGMFFVLGIDKIVELYKNSSDDYLEILNIFKNKLLAMNDELIIELQNIDNVLDIKNICYEKLREKLLESFNIMDIDKYSQSFKDSNPDLFLTDINISDELKDKYYGKNLELKDVIDNLEVFRNIPLADYLKNSDLAYFADTLGGTNFQKVIENHLDVLDYIVNNNQIYHLLELYTPSDNFDEAFTLAVKHYVNKHHDILVETNENNEIYYKLPDWVDSMNFKVSGKITSLDDLKSYDVSTILLDKYHTIVVDTFGVDNIIKFEEEYGFFSKEINEKTNEFKNIGLLGEFIINHNFHPDKKIDSYDEFTDYLAECLENMRKYDVFIDNNNYDFLEGDFRNKYPFIFMSIDAPEELKRAFYSNKITPGMIKEHKEYIPFLLDKRLENVINGFYDVKFTNFGDDDINSNSNSFKYKTVDFISYYSNAYGNEELLNWFSKYGNIISNLTSCVFVEGDSKEDIDKEIRRYIYDRIIENKDLNYEYLVNEDLQFVEEYSDIFIDYASISIEDEQIKEDIYKRFYNRKLKFDDVFKYPILVDLLKDKNLNIAFGDYTSKVKIDYLGSQNKTTELNIINLIGNELFLDLCLKYGRYLEHLHEDIYVFEQGFDYDELCLNIEKVISKNCLEGKIKNYHLDTPDFLKEQHSELFLDESAPDELKELFYNGLTFNDLKENGQWLEYLEGKSIKSSILKSDSDNEKMLEYFKLFGDEAAIKFGVNRTETVLKMINDRKVKLMKKWYDRTGQKFIPDFVVMQSFPLDEADKFLTSSFNWSNLMRINSFSNIPEGRDAMLKLAYSFGVFDNDQVGLKKLKDLLTSIPRTIPDFIVNGLDIIDNLEEQIDSVASVQFENPIGYNEYLELKNTLKEEGFNFDSNLGVMHQLYQRNEGGQYSLTIIPQKYPKSRKLIRFLLENYCDYAVLSPLKAHQLFGGFELRYDKDFREFLLANVDGIIQTPEYSSYISNIQKQFNDIKTYNSNRPLTLDLAISFVQSNKYTNVNIGNEKVADVSAIAGYSQEDFETLQEIYNYGKQRTFSSIPRIEKNVGNYNYQILRLDDPLAMIVGDLSDCCQQLGNYAEVCMEHSMVDKNGRIFVIKDEEGNIVAQSWVWRNQDLICFDNIEIPNKAFIRAYKNEGLDRKEFSKKIYDLYKEASHDLVVIDDSKYSKLLEEGKISQEQYDNLRLAKVTVGMGFNDISETLIKNASSDKGKLVRPLPFEEPVKLQNSLDIKDSMTQFILDEDGELSEEEEETLAIYNDGYIEYTDDNFTKRDLMTLERLEKTTKKDLKNLQTQLFEYDDFSKIVTTLAYNYSLNPSTTRVIMNSNFAIIYDVNGNKLKIADLLYNNEIENGKQIIDISDIVSMQIKLALDQISLDKVVDINSLNKAQRKVYNEALNVDLDIERGVGHAR